MCLGDVAEQVLGIDEVITRVQIAVVFERNRVDNSLQQMTVPAEITLQDGSIHRGKFLITAARSIFEVLNGETKFLEFETYDGTHSLIARPG